MSWTKKAGCRLAILATTFVVGAIAHFITVRQTPIVGAEIPTAAARQKDDLHRVYEAAMLSGDSQLRSEVVKRLSCRAVEEELEVRFVKLGENCMKADKNSKSALNAILESHAQWSRRNMAFVAEISTAEKARAYAIRHLHKTFD